jgi:hypothetical protein
MCLPFLNLSVRYDALLRGWCVAYVGDVSHHPDMLLLKEGTSCFSFVFLRFAKLF